MGLSDMLFEISVESGRYSDHKSLAYCSTKVYSQNGEDGMIAEIFRRIGERDRFFVEFASGDGAENNTRLLLEMGWRGVWVEAQQEEVDRACETFADFVRSGSLTVVCADATVESINRLLDEAEAPQQFDFLSADIDQNTSHVWNAMSRRSRVACVEYNAAIPSQYALQVPYDPAQPWDGSNWFGAGLKAIEYIGRAKGMSLVGCDLMGVNAFLVNEEEAIDRFLAPFTAETHWEPARYSPHPISSIGRTWAETR